MYHCSQCGTDFEGNFCPNCGTKRQEITACPACGAQVKTGAKFCGECGARLAAGQQLTPPPQNNLTADPAQSAAQNAVRQEVAAAQATPVASAQVSTRAANPAQGGIAKLYGYLFYLPCILFSVLSVLLFLFFLGDYGSVSFLGETMGTGSLYNLLSESDTLEMSGYGGTVYTLLALAVLSIIFSIVFLTLTLNKANRSKTVTLGGKPLYRATVLAHVSFVLYFILFIVGCVGAGQVGGDELDAGAPLVCTIVFSVIFGLLAGGSIVARWILGKKMPELAENEKAAMQAQTDAALQKRNATQTANKTAAGVAVSSDALSDAQTLNTIKDIKRLVRRRRLSSLFGFSILCPLVGIIGMFATLGRKIWDWNPAQIEHEHKTLVGRIVLNSIFAIFSIGYGIFFLVFMLPMITEGGHTPIWVTNMFQSMSALFFLIGFLHFCGIILAACAFSPLRRLGVAFYGKEQPSCLIDQPILSMKDLKESELQSTAVKKKFTDGLLVSVVCLVMAAIIGIGSFIGSLFLGNSFPVKAAKALQLGDYRSYVLESMGDPDEPAKEEDYDKASSFHYYSGEIKGLMQDMENLEKELEKAMESVLKGEMSESEFMKKEAELEKKAEDIEKKAKQIESYQEIVVYFGNNSSDYVTEVAINTNIQPNATGDNHKTVRDVTLNKTSLSASDLSDIINGNSNSSSRLSAKINYTDESYRNIYVPASALINAEPASGSNMFKIKWQDNWISPTNYYEATIKIETGSVVQQYTVSFELNGGRYNGSSYIDDIKCNKGDSLYLPEPTKNGCTFDGWYTSPDFYEYDKVYDYDFYPEKDCTLYAKWISEYTVSFELNGGRYNGWSYIDDAVCESGDYVSLYTPTKSGYKFDGWYTSASFSPSSKVTGSRFYPESNCTLYAKWISEYTVSFQLNGGRYNGSSYIDDAVCESGSSVLLPTPTKNGFTFGGWYTNSDFTSSSKIPTNSFTPSANRTLYAQWTCTVTFQLNGGWYNGSTNDYTQTCTENNYISIITPTRSDYKFDGWYTNSGFTSSSKVTVTSYYPSGNTTLYAKWTSVSQNPYTISTDLGSQTISSPDNVLSGKTRRTFQISGSSYISNSKNVDNSAAVMGITANSACTVSFNWSVSSESNYDKLYIWVVSSGKTTTKVNGVSGSQTNSLNLTLNAGEELYIAYIKDGSQASNNDQVTISNLYVQAK